MADSIVEILTIGTSVVEVPTATVEVVEIVAQGPQGIPGDAATGNAQEYVDSIPDLSLLFNNGIV